MQITAELVGLVIACVSLISCGVGIGMVRAKYLTKEEHEKLTHDCQQANDRRFSEIYDNRKEVWKKIDQIYEWMVKGVIVIKRNDE